MTNELSSETEKLVRSWDQLDSAWLRDYLVQGVEDPRINVQSILARHFLIDELAGPGLQSLMREECRFAAVADWLVRIARLQNDVEGRTITLHALKRGHDNAEGLEIPAFVLHAFDGLPCLCAGQTVPNYIEQFLSEPKPESNSGVWLDAFARIWRDLLSKQPRERPGQQLAPTDRAYGEIPSTAGKESLSVIEPACGSANDYRFLQSYGIAPLLDYTGFDLCPKNIENARSLFLGARFEVGNVFELSAADGQYEVCVVHDLLEHLSMAGLEQAVAEMCRVTRSALCLGFFQMDEIPHHIVRPRDEYHWNLLSLDQVRRLFANHGFDTQAIHIDSFQSRQFGPITTHNPNAYTLICRRASQRPQGSQTSQTGLNCNVLPAGLT
ncbi:MAG TPA: class I SAM-dependent methyltransferase [Verrucomicrobiae bacterium]|nr:class I SAM-dependent methyltransferase [Verrucomicrobiae bacterium]